MFSFRPHHFLCTLGFKGMGYSPVFVQNYNEIVKALHENEELLIHVVDQTDSICNACPHRRGELCDSHEKIQGLDARHANTLQLKAGDRISWRESKKRIKERMSLDKFHQVCEGCEWKSLGVCEAALKKLSDDFHEEKATP